LATAAPAKLPTYTPTQLRGMGKAWPALLQRDMEGTLPAAQLFKVERQAAAVLAQLGREGDAGGTLYGDAEMISDLGSKKKASN
jgi:hypothetical protein